MATRSRGHIRPAASRTQGPASPHATSREGVRRQPGPQPARTGGKTSRRDVALTWAESLALSPPSPHQVSLTVDLAWELFTSWDIRLVVGMYFQCAGYLQSPRERLPEVFVLQTRDVRVGTEHGRRVADELAQLLVDQFSPAAARYAELLAEAEAGAQQTRQPSMESVGTNYVFRTQPEAGVIEILRRSDGSVDGHGIAWLGTRLVEIRADADRLYVHQHAPWMGRAQLQAALGARELRAQRPIAVAREAGGDRGQARRPDLR